MLGESIAPFRMLDTVTAVIPLKDAIVLDATTARAAGHRHLSAWLAEVEEKWAEHANRRADGTPRMTLRDRLDHMRTLSLQGGPRAEARLVHTASGSLICATTIAGDAIIEHGAYWVSSITRTASSAARCSTT
jgi:hypothetical protein